MTYLAFHLCFILPPILLLLFVPPRPLRGASRWAVGALPVIALIAVVYTTPWDNHVVRIGVWDYGADRVVGTIGFVPVEEYALFILQPLLTGLWLYRFAAGRRWSRIERGPLRPRMIVATGLAAVAVVAVSMLLWQSTTYLGLILVWSLPVLALQCGWGGGIFSRTGSVMVAGVAVPTLYLWAADRIAIGLGVWEISPRYTTGIGLFGLPVEEAVFFLMTNLMVVQGLVAILWLSERVAVQRRAPFREERLPASR